MLINIIIEKKSIKIQVTLGNAWKFKRMEIKKQQGLTIQ